MQTKNISLNNNFAGKSLLGENYAAEEQITSYLRLCKMQGDQIYSRLGLLARFGSPFRFDISEREIKIFGRAQRRVKLSQGDGGAPNAGISFTFFDDGTMAIVHTGARKPADLPRAALSLPLALEAIMAYLARALPEPEQRERLRGALTSVDFPGLN